MKPAVILAAGCSWTAGTELADEQFFPDWPGLQRLPATAPPQRHPWVEQHRLPRLRGDQRLRQAVAAAEQRLAWPYQLQQLTNIQVVNIGQPAASQEQIHIQVVETLQQLLCRYKPQQILVILQITSPYRHLFCWDDSWRSVVRRSDKNHEDFPGEQQLQQILTSWDSNRLELKWLHDINNSWQLCRAAGVALLLVEAWQRLPRPRLTGCFADLRLPLDAMDGFAVESGVRTLCPGMHPPAAAHLRFATYLRDKLVL